MVRRAALPDLDAVTVALVIDRARALRQRQPTPWRQALADAGELEAAYPGAAVGPWNLRDGTTGLTASWHGGTVAGTAGEVREWLDGQSAAAAS